ncbi:MAG: hypothetical protein H6855_06055 [Rhodospirillales bacterium]|nr:hypothetical protein [Rhodospirillales bacterium]MCB9965627.1 hypothetical protein [Rhodospirillales bacterium]MCB9973050.1 hypothetical protein [Rhodospirillales bacterium]
MLGLGLGLGLKSYKAKIDGLQPFAIDKFVAIGASITNYAFEIQITRTLCEAIALRLYGKTLIVSEEATGGKGASDQLADMPGILANYSGQSNVVFANHMGGNDITYGTEFLNKPQVDRDRLFADYQATWDLVKNAGHRFFSYGLTFRNIGGTTLDNDPTAPKVNELGGSYTYNRDWISQISQSRVPYLMRGDAMGLSHYEYTRSVYDMVLDTDNIHPTEIGDLMIAVNMFLGVMEASEGRLREAPVEVNFNNAFQSPSVPVDIVIATHTIAGSIVPSNANINWLGAPYGTTSGLTLYSESLHNTDGSAASGVSVLYAGANKSFPVSTFESGDTSATLNNSMLRNSYISVTGSSASVAAMVSGLEPNRTYEISMCRIRQTDILVYANSAAAVAPTTDEIATISTRADPYGRIFVRAKENSATDSVGFSGLRIRSI